MLGGLGKLLSNEDFTAGRKLDECLRRVHVKLGQSRDRMKVEVAGRGMDLAVRPHSTDHEVVWQTFTGRQYEVPTVPGVRSAHRAWVQEVYEGLVADGMTPLIIDCGANMGASASWFHLKYPHSRVVAIEPAPDNCRMLHRNLDRLPEVDIVEAGVGAEDGQMFLANTENGHWGYQTSDQPSEAPVRIVSLASVLERYPADQFAPFLLKVDIEGAEKGLFGSGWEQMQRFPLIILEPHDFCMAGQHTSAPFFQFHSAMEREFLYQYENVFSFRMGKPAAVTA